MARPARLVASATVGTLIALGAPIGISAQTTESQPAPASAVRTTATGGAIFGTVQDAHGHPIANVVVSALGATTTIAVTDKKGQFEFGPLAPGPYLLRAHLAGYTAARAQTVRVNANAQSSSAFTLAQAASEAPILAAGLGGAPSQAAEQPASTPAAAPASDDDAAPAEDQSETSWRIRHARRSILKDLTIPTELLASGEADRPGTFIPVEFLGRAVESPAHLATSLFSDADLTGQVNFLTTASFDSPQDFLSTDVLSRNIAYVRLGARVGSDADWTARGAVNQADISSWIVAGSYTTRALNARHSYNIGLSYSTQRYDGGNLLTLRDVSEGTRNVGTASAYDTFRLSSMVAVAYGGEYARYDYLKDRTLLSPRVQATITPAEQFRITASVARKALAPGAEEFLPPGDTGIWLPPQRTFSSLNRRGSFNAEETTQAQVAVERDFGVSTVSVRAFRQHVNDQLVAVFGAELAGEPAANLGHYLVGNVGDADANGYAAAIRTVIADRIRGSVEYAASNAEMTPGHGIDYLVLLTPSAARRVHDRVHDLSTSIEAEVPETATKVLVLYRVGTGFAQPASAPNSTVDSRFDVQVRQALPFMNFSTAKWEMLLAVRNFFRESGPEQSVFDERFAVRPPKRVVGGVTLRF